MPTTKTRINISVSKALEKELVLRAKRDSVPVATKARELIEESLEMEESQALIDLIKEREKHNHFVSHESVWKKYMR